MAELYTYPDNDVAMVNESHINWRDLGLSDKVKAMSLGPSDLSHDTRSDKELLAEALKNQNGVA